MIIGKKQQGNNDLFIYLFIYEYLYRIKISVIFTYIYVQENCYSHLSCTEREKKKKPIRKFKQKG